MHSFSETNLALAEGREREKKSVGQRGSFHQVVPLLRVPFEITHDDHQVMLFSSFLIACAFITVVQIEGFYGDVKIDNHTIIL